MALYHTNFNYPEAGIFVSWSFYLSLLFSFIVFPDFFPVLCSWMSEVLPLWKDIVNQMFYSHTSNFDT